MKRSAQIGLLVMGTLATTSAAGYFAINQDQACEARAAQNPQDAPPQDCRRSVWRGSGSGSGGYHSFYSGHSSSSSGASTTTTSTPSGGSAPAQRGGFGGFASHIAHAFSGS
jgi:hypothetical protein